MEIQKDQKSKERRVSHSKFSFCQTSVEIHASRFPWQAVKPICCQRKFKVFALKDLHVGPQGLSVLVSRFFFKLFCNVMFLVISRATNSLCLLLRAEHFG